MKSIRNCPVCEESYFKDYLSVKDHMITREEFKIVECDNCGFHFTNPIPEIDKIGEYYKSEEYISHSSNKKGVINFLYNRVRNITLKEKVKWIKNETDGKCLLDIGSGTGHFLKVANDHGFKGTGLEPDADARDFAHKNNHVRSSDQAELYNIESNSFDVITMWHVLEHVYDLRKDLKRIDEILKSDGRLFIAVPNMNSHDARHYKEDWAAYDVPRHLYHFQKNDISRLMLDFGFDLKKVIPMPYDAYYVSMLSEKYKNRFSLLGVLRGFISNMKARKYGYSSQVYVFEKK
ncbi:class I SAM-dependent methyltransferase [Brumimicrobium aurantiacum]|uniref:Class I SAM-dependent methyltransferase n=1 Tax=Brumimicrobium aurantiacum TaxID=1737063 RepID=A0A3E1F234_9FLAO|nr:class I SAM-dependent methyltransferase [Brumimicrobium aurantiacum]RFC55865.1 class I SAM-dependent methyltransferase [Brumimicrobium aurantiacum]